MITLVTGAAGFIGMHVAQRLLARGESVVGLDNLNDYYDVSLKQARLDRLTQHANFEHVRIDIADRPAVEQLFATKRPRRIVHLAAQAGVRYSLLNPHAFVESNLVGFIHILEGARHVNAEHMVYASSSSVYGGNARLPFSEHDAVDHPLSLYAATKKSNELMAHTYSHLFRLPTAGLRFFTVFGPWGRPDMALFRFTKAILEGRPIDVYNHGRMVRDFTYIDDIVEGVVRVLDRVAAPAEPFDASAPDPATSSAPYRVFNIGNSQPVPLEEYIAAIESALGLSAERRYLPLQDGDVPATQADMTELDAWVGARSRTAVRDGVAQFVSWYRQFYGV